MLDVSQAALNETLFLRIGACGALMAALDWSKTPLGPVTGWPPSLRSAVDLCLASPFPTAIYWGPELVLVYNDAWSPILGTKHPAAMGTAGRDVWPDIWHLMGPLLTRTLELGEPLRQTDSLLPLQKFENVEECYFDNSFTAIRSESGKVGGVFNAVVETTYRVINARRSRLLRSISKRAVQAISDEQICRAAAEAMSSDPEDMPFALMYVGDGGDRGDGGDGDGRPFRLVADCGIPDAARDALSMATLGSDPWQIVTGDSTMEIRVAALPESLQVAALGPWPESSQSAAVIPLILHAHGRVGFLIAGISARRALDEDYRTFLESAGDQLVRGLTNVRALDEVKRRADTTILVERLSLAQTTASIGVWEYDPSGPHCILSPECGDLYGFPRDMPPEEVVRESFRRMHPDDVPLVQQHLAEVVDSKETMTWENRFSHPTKGDRWLTTRARQVTKPPAAPRVIGVSMDITEQRATAMALKAQKDRWRQLAEAMPQLVWTCTADGACDFLSRQWLEYTGKPEAEQLGDRWLEQVHEDERAAVTTAWHLAVQQRTPFDTDVRIRRSDGIYRRFKTTAAPVLMSDGTVAKWYGSNTDIHDLWEARVALLQAESRLALAIKGSGMGTFDWHIPTGALSWSKSHFTLFGYDPVVSTARYELWRTCVHPDDIGAVESALNLARRDNTTYTAEYRIFRHDDGGMRWISAFGWFLRDGGDEAISMVGVVFDVTTRKQAELELARRVDELGRANAELEHFASIASHDLQEPLRMISSYAGILERRYGSMFDDKARGYFGRIINGAHRMRSIINAILAYSQVDKQPPMLQAVSTAEALEDALEHLQAEVTAKQAEVTVGFLPTLVADRLRLTQLFQNLVSNALKFSVTNRTMHIRIAAKEAADEWVFTVADNGIGISLANQEKVFRIFQRLHAIDAYPGSGIGLASCKKIVEQHGGRLWVESQLDVGSTFYFSILKRTTLE